MSKPNLHCEIGYWTIIKLMNLVELIHNMKELNEDYHILTLQDNEIETTRFECYNSPHEPETLEEITKLTKLSIERCLRNEEENRLRELEDE